MMVEGLNILIVDDVVDNIQVAMSILKEDSYNLTFALGGEEALSLVSKNDFDLILLDIMMSDMDGYEVCKRIKENPDLKDIPIIFLTAKTDIESISEAFNIGAVDYIVKPFNAEELIARVKIHLELHQSRIVLKQNNLSISVKYEVEKKRLLSELEETQKEIIYILSELAEAVSDETGRHIKRVANISRVLAEKCTSLSQDDIDTIYHASPMHDIGKIAVDRNILHKPGKLTHDEFEIMKTHTEIAYKILRSSDRKILKAAATIAMEHHECWDGSGYPKGLSGENIHIYGRIVAIADVFDALTHKRSYKEPWSAEKALKYMIDGSGKQFDPVLIELFVKHIDEFIYIINHTD